MRNILTFILFTLISTFAYSYQKSDNEIKDILIQQSVSAYLSSVGNCPCPYNKDRAGRSCGKRSAWSKAGGQSPICFPNDVTKDMLEEYKNNKLLNSRSSNIRGAG